MSGASAVITISAFIFKQLPTSRPLAPEREPAGDLLQHKNRCRGFWGRIPPNRSAIGSPLKPTETRFARFLIEGRLPSLAPSALASVGYARPLATLFTLGLYLNRLEVIDTARDKAKDCSYPQIQYDTC